MFRRAKVPQVILWLGSTLPILALVNAQMGLALMPRTARRIRFESVVYRKMNLEPGIESESHLIWHDHNDNPAFLMMLEAIRGAVWKQGV